MSKFFQIERGAGWSRSPQQIEGVECYAGPDGWWVSEFLARTDILICLLPLTDSTRGILATVLHPFSTEITLFPGS